VESKPGRILKIGRILGKLCDRPNPYVVARHSQAIPFAENAPAPQHAIRPARDPNN